MTERLRIFVRALRLPFLGASVMPFLAGTLEGCAGWREIMLLPALLGLGAVAATHLAANLLNDYADDLLGADRLDPAYYGFYGGSRLIQQGVLTRAFYLRAGLSFALLALLCGAGLLLLRGDVLLLAVIGAALLLAVFYSCPPLRLCYRGWGEGVILLLFGPVTVAGGAYVQSGHLPGVPGMLTGLIFGLLTAGILLANEIPDAPTDAAAGKRTLVVRCGAERGWLLYAGVAAAALALLVARYAAGGLGAVTLLALAVGAIAVREAWRMRLEYADKAGFVNISKLVIIQHNITGILLILGLL